MLTAAEQGSHVERWDADGWAKGWSVRELGRSFAKYFWELVKFEICEDWVGAEVTEDEAKLEVRILKSRAQCVLEISDEFILKDSWLGFKKAFFPCRSTEGWDVEECWKDWYSLLRTFWGTKLRLLEDAYDTLLFDDWDKFRKQKLEDFESAATSCCSEDLVQDSISKTLSDFLINYNIKQIVHTKGLEKDRKTISADNYELNSVIVLLSFFFNKQKDGKK